MVEDNIHKSREGEIGAPTPLRNAVREAKMAALIDRLAGFFFMDFETRGGAMWVGTLVEGHGYVEDWKTAPEAVKNWFRHSMENTMCLGEEIRRYLDMRAEESGEAMLNRISDLEEALRKRGTNNLDPKGK